MVMLWSPEPCKYAEGVSPRPEEDDLDFEDAVADIASPYFGYELLAHDANGAIGNDLEENRYAGYNDLNSHDSDAEDVSVGTDSENNDVEEPGDEKSESLEEAQRPEIEINDDEIRQAMSNIVLPSSSIPSWATDVPESQWVPFLISRIKNIQNGTSQ